MERSARGPEGVAAKPTALDDAVLGATIFRRWDAPYGWCVGKISSKITSATPSPRLFKNFNFRCVWSDGWTNNMLTLDQYAGGPAAAYGSWVILEKASAEEEQAEEEAGEDRLERREDLVGRRVDVGEDDEDEVVVHVVDGRRHRKRREVAPREPLVPFGSASQLGKFPKLLIFCICQDSLHSFPLTEFPYR